MSISVPLAVTMMIGTAERALIARQTSIPESFGSMRSSRTRSGWTASNLLSASGPSRAIVTSNPSRAESEHERVDERLLVFCKENRDGVPCRARPLERLSDSDITAHRVWGLRELGLSGSLQLVLRRHDELEGGSLTLSRLDLDAPLVVGCHMPDDRKAEPGPTGLAAPALVDPVEALEDAVEVTRRDPDSVIDDGMATSSPVTLASNSTVPPS